MTSLVPGLGKRQLHCQLWRDRKIILRAGPELKFENYESVQHGRALKCHFIGTLRTFARKFSNIDFFPKNLPLKDDELVMSEM